jgi:hypothetical protein
MLAPEVDCMPFIKISELERGNGDHLGLKIRHRVTQPFKIPGTG